VARLLTLVPYLHAHGEVRVDEAAAALGVDPDQLFRDLKVLFMCGLPGGYPDDLIDVDIDALEGPDGVRRDGVIRVSNADYLTRPLRLDSSEAAALIVALRALRDGSGDDVRPIVDRTLGKLEAAAGDAAAVAAHVDLHLPAQDPAAAATRELLATAVRDRHQVRIDYYVPARDEATARVVDPLRLVSAQGNEYLEAWCHSAEGQRLFRLDRISGAQALGTPVEEHPDLAPRDLGEGLFQPSPDDLLATLLLEPEARWVAEYFPTEDTQEAGDGRLRVRMRVADPAWLVRLLLRLGSAARVEDPAGLQEDLAQAATEALANYR
jgi:proteasome accessory factor C